MSRKWLLYSIKFAVAGALIYWLESTNKLDFSPLLNHPIGLAHFLGLVGIFGHFLLSSLRWHGFLRIKNPEHRFMTTLLWNWIGEFFALVTPGGSGSEIARGYYAFRNAANAQMVALATVLVDRIVGLFAMMMLGTMSFMLLYFGGEYSLKALWLIGLTTVAILFGVLFTLIIVDLRLVRSVISHYSYNRFFGAVETIIGFYSENKMVFWRGVVISLFAHLSLMASFICAGIVLNVDLDWKIILLAVPFIFIANVLPISPGGIGVGETAAAFLFATLGVTEGATIMLVVRVWLVLIQLSGSMVYLTYGHKKSKPA